MFIDQAQDSCPIIPLSESGLDAWLASAPEQQAQWVRSSGFRAGAGSHLLVPDAEGGLAVVLSGCGEPDRLWALAHLPAVLPEGVYHLESDWTGPELTRACLGWGLAGYRFDRYKQMEAPAARLVLPETVAKEVRVMQEATDLVRDLINTPAIDLGPAELAGEARRLADAFGADCRVIEREAVANEFPAVHAVGQAASRPPCMIRMEWGRDGDPVLALVGKGVIFDSGGLNLKPGSGMIKMKKDMGGAAHVLGLARIIMDLGLPVKLRVYIPAVENAIAGNAYRPSDIIRTRNGTSIEIGNTDAEGRVILADALSWACEEGAERIIDFATLTGAARAALGEDLPPVYGRDPVQVQRIQELSFQVEDPLWHMPLYRPYKSEIQPAQADLSNTGTTGMAGSVLAALFLEHFVTEGTDWLHLDVFGWNLGDRPGRPRAGEAQGMRAIWEWLREVYPREG